MKTATLSLHIPTQTASAVDEWYIAIPWLGKWLLEYVAFSPATAVATDATDFLTSTITANDGAAGADSATVATHKTELSGGVALVLKTTVAPTVTQPATVFQRGHQIKVAKTVGGAGKILDGTYTFGLRKVG